MSGSTHKLVEILEAEGLTIGELAEMAAISEHNLRDIVSEGRKFKVNYTTASLIAGALYRNVTDIFAHPSEVSYLGRHAQTGT